jgi:hypothetical protein
VLQELPGLKQHDHQAAELLHHTINGLLYASPRSLVITLQHFCRVRDAVEAARQQQQHHGSNDGSSDGYLPLPSPTWQLDETVGKGGAAAAAPDLSTLQGTMQVCLKGGRSRLMRFPLLRHFALFSVVLLRLAHVSAFQQALCSACTCAAAVAVHHRLSTVWLCGKLLTKTSLKVYEQHWSTKTGTQPGSRRQQQQARLCSRSSS